jgi:hypothetical protein
VAKDACGNEETLEYYVSSDDEEDPVIEPFEPVTLNCSDRAGIEAEKSRQVRVTDNCFNDVPTRTVTFSNTSVPFTCQNYTITRNATVVDECGNVDTDISYIYVHDVEPPRLSSYPENQTVTCKAIPAPEVLSATDNCDPVLNVTLTQTNESVTCVNHFVLKRTWRVCDDCGLCDEHTAYVHVEDRRAPQFKSGPPNVTINCTDPLPKGEVCVDDDCDGVTVSYSTWRVNGTCEGSYKVYREWVATDACGKTARYLQVITVQDVSKPEFTSTPINNSPYECGLPAQQNLTARDDCSGVNVTILPETIFPGRCAANYTVERRWLAVDGCGNQDIYYENYTSHDSIPPVWYPSDVVCYRPFTYDAFLKLEHVSVPNNFFAVFDACSPVNITITGCSSNQDYLTTPIPLPQGNFNSHCYYVPALDQIIVTVVLDPLVPEGRMFNITAVVTDECGHQTPMHREIYVPLNNSSPQFPGINLPPGFNITEDCSPVPFDVELLCPCEYSQRLCAETQALPQGFDAGNHYYNSSSDETYFFYFFDAADGVNQFAIGIDTTKVEVVRTLPESVEFGPSTDSYVNGLVFRDMVGVELVTIVLKGHVSVSGMVPVQFDGAFGGDNVPCSPTTMVSGPNTSDVVVQNPVSGHVYIDSVLTGADQNGRVPLPGVVVVLLTQSGAIAAATVSGKDGSFRFSGISNPALYRIQIADDGVLRAPGGDLYFYDNVENFGPDVYGPPVQLQASNNNLFLRIHAEQPAGYTVVRHNNPLRFNGNGKPTSWWVYNLGNWGRRVQNAEVDFAVLKAGQWLSACGSVEALLTDSDGAKRALVTAALNENYFLGVFEPYDAFAEVVIKFAAQALCRNSPPDPVYPSGDRSLLVGLLYRIANAD